MNFERIGASHPLFEASFTLYEASFPPNERRTREDHLRALQDADFFPLGALQAPVLEANLIGFSGNLYGKELAIWLEDHIRGELRFESVQALRDRVLYDRQLVADFYQR